MFAIYSSLSTSPNLRYVRRLAVLVLAVILVTLIGSVLLLATFETHGGRDVSALALVVIYLVVLACLLSPIPVIVWRRRRRAHELAKKYPDQPPIVVYLLPGLREFIDEWGKRRTYTLDETVIIVKSGSTLQFWSGNGPFDVMCEVPARAVEGAEESRFDGYRCIRLLLAGTAGVELVLCATAFGVDQHSVPTVVAELDSLRDASRSK